ncbi:peptidase family C78-domain-containing protein [Amylocarpus encephaloides]|uniref:Peptidase family C78-domain-containing protein n=1 Tax=Amylocarpus encephaloides TaxID=45428 RepID=A0A9P7YGB6_9HELO|nr:peptidase family C78-domain-containing protein [Amylocarpus encephaloides]
MTESLSKDCPFCGFKTDNEYQILLHMETLHSEDNSSPFVVKDNEINGTAVDEDEEVQSSRCPVEGCGEELLARELDSHLELHAAEQENDSGLDHGHHIPKKMERGSKIGESFDTRLSYALRNIDDQDDSASSSHSHTPDHQAEAKTAWKGILNMPDNNASGNPNARNSSNTSKRRLGVSKSYLGNVYHHILRVTKKSQLGPHHDEKRMPSWLVDVLKGDGETSTMNRLDENGRPKKVKVCPNQSIGILPVLQQLLEQDPNVAYAYLCHFAVRHVSKLKHEGGFCGYRNIQMLTSHINGVKSQGYQIFKDKIPSIFDIQEHVEMAWDLGINVDGRTETGGIRGTRKYIGTPEAQAMFCKLGIAVETQAVKSKRHRKDVAPNTPPPPKAHELLFATVEAYFTNDCTDYDPRVRCTNLPPIYFQHPGHSMTIVGFEKHTDNAKSLIVFDPMYHDPASVMKHVGIRFNHRNPAEPLKLYRRGSNYLRKYDQFEILKLCPPAGQKGTFEVSGPDSKNVVS